MCNASIIDFYNSKGTLALNAKQDFRSNSNLQVIVRGVLALNHSNEIYFPANCIKGEGTIQSNSYQFLSRLGLSSDFTGTIQVASNSQFGCDGSITNSAVKMVIEDGSDVIPNSLSVLNCDIELSGYGLSGHAPTYIGAMCFERTTEPVYVNGKVTLKGNSRIGENYDVTKPVIFAGDMETNGYLLEFQKRFGETTFVITGDVASTGEQVGTIQLNTDISDFDNTTPTYLCLGDDSAAEASAPTTQTINANLANRNKDGIIFQPGANRTVAVNGTLSTSGADFVKTGAGTLKIYTAERSEVSAGNLVVNAGELDYKGYFNGSIQVNSGAVFSPGNSIGQVSVTGDVVLTDAETLFEFGEYTGEDENHDVLVLENGTRYVANNSVIRLSFEDAAEAWAEPGQEYRIVSNGGFTEGFDYTPMLANYNELFGLKGKGDGLYLFSLASSVPEPSAWALLILGAAGLFYSRKRK